MNTQRLSHAIRTLALCDHADLALAAGVAASVRTLNEGVYQWTKQCADAETLRKHRARLVAALHAIADALEQEELTDELEAAMIESCL